jgi:hypothetical protein
VIQTSPTIYSSTAAKLLSTLMLEASDCVDQATMTPCTNDSLQCLSNSRLGVQGKQVFFNYLIPLSNTKKRYPSLASILSNEPHAPRGNVISKNVHYGTLFFNYCGNDKIRAFLNDTNTLRYAYNVSDFVDPAKFNFQLRPNHPAYQEGFAMIPFDQIGLDGKTGPLQPPIYTSMSTQPVVISTAVISSSIAVSISLGLLLIMISFFY